MKTFGRKKLASLAYSILSLETLSNIDMILIFDITLNLPSVSFTLHIYETFQSGMIALRQLLDIDPESCLRKKKCTVTYASVQEVLVESKLKFECKM